MRLITFIFPGLILAFELISLVKSVCINDKVICRCGTSSTTVSIPCIGHVSAHEYLCAAYQHCESCEDDVTHCITCPKGRSGLFCDHASNFTLEDGYETWNEELDAFDDDETETRLVTRDLSCPNLRAPKLGSFKCWHRGYERECTAECLPGHAFESGIKQIKLVCESGVWLPRSSFPPCISQGYCKIKITGAGYYNCTIGIGGTTCSITCYGRGYRPTSGTFYCYPGDSWNPPLPYCAAETAEVNENGAERDRTPSCRCQNGGSCNSWNQECRCPSGYRGTFCEIREYDRRTQCQSPPQIENGEAKTTNGDTVRQNHQFYEGSSVVYSCHSEHYLVGESLLKCTQYGVWSDSPPRCISLNTPKPEPKTGTCPDPGQVDNGVRRIIDERRISRNQKFYEGNTVIFSCNNGFALIGESMLKCSASGEWSSALPVCRSIESLTTERAEVILAYCKDPGVDPNGIKTVSPWINPKTTNRNTNEVEYPAGTEIKYSCKGGYDLEGERSLRCLYSGFWSSSVPTCLRKTPSVTTTTEEGPVYCKEPGVDPNGIKTVSIWINAKNRNSEEEEYPQGTKINYSCKEGYELDGERAIICLFSGYWSSSTPKCRTKTSAAIREEYCENPGEISNGRKNVLRFIDPRTNKNILAGSPDFPQGVKIEFYCNSGFTLRGSQIIECQVGGTWSSANPTCERKTPSCGHSFFSLTGKILGGERTSPGEWPWQVAYAEDRRQGMTITCGATLISHNTVVTAAHCILPRRLEKTFLYFAKYYSDFSEDTQQVLSRKASEFIVHPRYNRRNMDNDIALVRFDPDVSYNTRIQPICLPTQRTTSQNLQSEVKGYVTGWGTTENGTDSDVMLMAQLPVVSTSQCQNTYRRLNVPVEITNNMYCAGYDEGGIDSCTGDSGGPMVFYNNVTESYVLEGIVSFGVKGPTGSCGQKNRYGVYTKVSNYVTWIKRYT